MKIKGKIVSVVNEEDLTKVLFVNSLGKEIEFELYDHKDGSAGLVRNGIDYAGLWFENKRLVDYDMVFELSKYAIIAIRKAGFTVPRDFEPES